MHRQRNLHLLSSCTRVKVSSVAVASKSLPSTSRAFSKPSKPRTGRASAPLCSITTSNSQSSHNFQTRASFTTNNSGADFDETNTSHNKGPSRDQKNGSSKQRQKGTENTTLVHRKLSEKERTLDIRDRTIMLTPWRGAPTLLHALGFIRELEDKYGKIWWAGLTKEKANPYEYNRSIIVIFEDPASLTRIPGFSDFNLQPQSRTITQSNDVPSSSPGVIDLGPSSALDPLANPNSQALLKRVEGNAQKQNMSPLFVPWSEKLNVASYQKGGPSLADILSFLGPKNPEGHSGDPSSEPDGDKTSSNELTASASETSSMTVKKATWEEFDEPVNIDAVVRKFGDNRVYIQQPPMQRPYFRQNVRLSVARAFVDFAGFSDAPVSSMRGAMEAWQEELDLSRTATTWEPWSKAGIEVVAEQGRQEHDESAVSLQEVEEDWDDLAPGVWAVVNAGSSQKRLSIDGELAPKSEPYQRIAVDEELEGNGAEGWEGLGSHPLQFPANPTAEKESIESTTGPDLTETVRSRLASLPAELERLADTSSSGDPLSEGLESSVDGLKAAAKVANETRSHSAGNSENLQDSWRTDPRPFRSGLGGDEPPSYHSNTLDQSQRHPWTKPGLKSTSARERGAMSKGAHSPKSQGWGNDKRGKKLRSREEVEALSEFGLGNLDELATEHLRSARSRGELGKRENWQVRRQHKGDGDRIEESTARIHALAGKEQRMKEVKNLKDRLRAILDGTNVD